MLLLLSSLNDSLVVALPPKIQIKVTNCRELLNFRLKHKLAKSILLVQRVKCRRVSFTFNMERAETHRDKHMHSVLGPTVQTMDKGWKKESFKKNE